MDQNRRTFLRSLAAVCATGIGSKLKVAGTLVATGAAGSAATAASAASTAAAAGTAAVSLYGTGVRAQVFEVIVRQALAGAPWKEICRGPMQINSITSEEIEKEVERRKLIPHDAAKAEYCSCIKCSAQRQLEAKEKNARLEAARNQIAHSEQSPCGCNDCYRKIVSQRYQI